MVGDKGSKGIVLEENKTRRMGLAISISDPCQCGKRARTRMKGVSKW